MIPSNNFRQLSRRSHLFWQIVFGALAIGLFYYGLNHLREILLPVVSALLISYLLDPLVTRLKSRFNIPRSIGTLILFVAALLLIAILFLLVVPVLVHEIQSFGEIIPEYLRKIQATMIGWVERNFQIVVPRSLEEMMDRTGDNLRDIASSALLPLRSMAGTLAEQVVQFLSLLG